MKKSLFVLAMLIMLPLCVKAQETLSPYHWSNDYINYFKVRGYLAELNHLNRPYQRLQIARALLKAEEIPAQDQAAYDLLIKEFNREIVRISRQKTSPWTRLAKKALKLLSIKTAAEENVQQMTAGVYARADYDTSARKTSFEIHPRLGWSFDEHLFMYANFKIFNNPQKDYDGKEFSGLYAHNEQAYLQYHNDWLLAKIGRDWLQLGPGRTGQLLFSDNSRPFDMYYLSLGQSLIKFQFWGIMLNRRTLTEKNEQTLAMKATRFINGHRLVFNFQDKYRFALNEVILYGGPNISWEPGYLNPLMLYYAYNVNGPGIDANIFYSFEWDVYLNNFELYGEFLVDDFQVEKKKPGDLEPNELGFLAGMQYANLFNLAGSLVNLEYVQVRNRTYNAPVHDWEKFLHHNRVIGYELGNNFERYSLSLQKWLKGRWQTVLSLSYIRQGEGSVQDTFNTDYLGHTVAEDYTEPFPYGIVENHLQVGCSLFYKPVSAGHMELQIAYNTFGNYNHIKNNSHAEWSFCAGLWLEWEKIIQMGK